jgi:UDP-N-acetylmuramoyl-tripeptide--D-alanyl-D-alanine ligase
MFNSLSKIKELFECINYTTDKEVTGFQFDSRLIKTGDVFVALKAERDGHEFINKAIEQGAIAAIVEDIQENLSIPQFKTNNTWLALELIAQKSKAAFNGKTIAITGSCGKTTNKQMLLHCLNNCYATEGNFNGLLGLPYTMAHLNQNADYAVFELGTDDFGNIDKLTTLAKPDIAIVTSVGPAHLEMFKTIENIVIEKLSIANGLSENGCLIIPHEYLNQTNYKNTFTFSINDTNAYAYISKIEGNNVTAIINNNLLNFTLIDTASHKLTNALTMLITLEQLGFKLEDIKHKIESFKAPAGRGEQIILNNNVKLFDESYNANPLSMKKALESFKNLSSENNIAILGDMLELGPDEVLLHKQLANHLTGIAQVYTVGNLMEHLYTELTNIGFKTKHFNNADELVDFIKVEKFENCDMIIKGSHGSKVYKAVEVLKEKN